VCTVWSQIPGCNLKHFAHSGKKNLCNLTLFVQNGKNISIISFPFHGIGM
jgi:hypothetical protein